MMVLSARERKLVALGLLVGVVVLVEGLVVQPILSGFAERADERAGLALQFAHQEQTIASLPRLRQMARASAARQRAYVAMAASPDAAGSTLEDRLRLAAESVGGEYRAGDHDGTGPQRVRARAVVRMPIDKLALWLEHLENEQPYLVVEQLGIGADAALASQKAEALDVKIEVSVPFARASA